MTGTIKIIAEVLSKSRRIVDTMYSIRGSGIKKCKRQLLEKERNLRNGNILKA